MDMGNDTVFLSVIIPVYNAEKYITECVLSLLCSDITEMELILVDDGSTDHSYQTCIDLSNKDDRIIVYQKENGGSSTARNFGLSKARGNYISFIDSDDYVEPREYAAAFQETVKEDLDIGCFNIMSDKVIGKPETDNVWTAFIENPVYMHSVCNKFFRHTVVSKLQFDKDLRVFEDMLFCGEAFNNAEKIMYLDKTAYIYRTVNSSLTHSSCSERKSADAIKAISKLANDYQYSNADMDFNRFFRFRHQMAALIFLTEPDIFNINEYRKLAPDDNAYRYVKERKYRFLCWSANRHLDLIPQTYMCLKKRKAKYRKTTSSAI